MMGLLVILPDFIYTVVTVLVLSGILTAFIIGAIHTDIQDTTMEELGVFDNFLGDPGVWNSK